MGYSFIIEDYLKEAVLNKDIEAIKKVAMIIVENTEKTEMLLREKEDIRGDIKVILTEIKNLNENMNRRFEDMNKRFDMMFKFMSLGFGIITILITVFKFVR